MEKTNYCLQAHEGLMNVAKDQRYDSIDRNHSRQLADAIQSAVKFRIPDYGRVLDFGDRTIQQLSEEYVTEFRLPYPSIALEYQHPQNSQGGFTSFDAVVVVATEVNEADGSCSILVEPAVRAITVAGKVWLAVNFVAKVTRDGVSCRPATKNGCEIASINPDDPNITEDVRNEVSAVVSLIAALACKNVETIDDPAPKLMNRKRLSKGQKPLFDYKTLTVKINEKTSKTSQYVEDRNSPRMHLRRGHIRRLASGVTTWVQSCMVGSAKNGMVMKDYKVTA